MTGWFYAFAFVGATFGLLWWIANRKPSDGRHIKREMVE